MTTSNMITVAVICCTLKLIVAEQVGMELQKVPSYTEVQAFMPGFLSSFSVTILSELGDKTFFIAAILAMNSSRLTVFLGSISALIVMTVLSVALGTAASLIPHVITHYLSVTLFAVFGLKMILEAYRMSPDNALEEFKDTEHEIRSAKKEADGRSSSSGVFCQSLSMTFLAEWGDRSQISTVLLAARHNIYGVTAGTILGHSICTFLAVIAGRLVADRISVKTITFVGGIIFFGCALNELIAGLTSTQLMM